jgi:hypothetical protein
MLRMEVTRLEEIEAIPASYPRLLPASTSAETAVNCLANRNCGYRQRLGLTDSPRTVLVPFERIGRIRSGRRVRTWRVTSGITPTACANGTRARRSPRRFIRKSKYDGSEVSICLSSALRAFSPAVLLDVSPPERRRFMCVPERRRLAAVGAEAHASAVVLGCGLRGAATRQ